MSHLASHVSVAPTLDTPAYMCSVHLHVGGCHAKWEKTHICVTPQKSNPHISKRRMPQLKALDILDWYYNQSDAALGFSAQSFDGMPQSDRDFHPGEEEMRAASKQRSVRSALAELSPSLQRGIEAAYSPPRLATQLRLKYGILAGLVAHHWPPADAKDLTRIVETSTKILVTAHQAFLLSYKPPGKVSSWLKRLQAPYSSPG